MAARVFRYYYDATTTTGESYRLTHYMSNSKSVGLKGILQFFAMCAMSSFWFIAGVSFHQLKMIGIIVFIFSIAPMVQGTIG